MPLGDSTKSLRHAFSSMDKTDKTKPNREQLKTGWFPGEERSTQENNGTVYENGLGNSWKWFSKDVPKQQSRCRDVGRSVTGWMDACSRGAFNRLDFFSQPVSKPERRIETQVSRLAKALTDGDGPADIADDVVRGNRKGRIACYVFIGVAGDMDVT